MFTPNGYSRCIHVYIPQTRNGSKFPVLITINGYSQGTLYPNMPSVKAADYYGFALIRYVSVRCFVLMKGRIIFVSFLSSHKCIMKSMGSTGPMTGAGNFGLEFPANGIVNPSNPTPCSKDDSRDYVYIEGVLDFIADNVSMDEANVFFEGFSQSSMFAAYASVCFADRVKGLWQGGSGLAKTYHTPVVPGWQGQCSASAFSVHGKDCCNGENIKLAMDCVVSRVTLIESYDIISIMWPNKNLIHRQFLHRLYMVAHLSQNMQ